MNRRKISTFAVVTTAIGTLVVGALIVGRVLTTNHGELSLSSAIIPAVVIAVLLGAGAALNVVVPGRRMRALREAHPGRLVFSVRRSAQLRKTLKALDSDARIIVPNQIFGARAGIVVDDSGLSFYGGTVPPRHETTIGFDSIEAITVESVVHGLFETPCIVIELVDNDDLLLLFVSNEESFAGMGVHDGEVVDPISDELQRRLRYATGR
jgi:hypothetical protein